MNTAFPYQIGPTETPSVVKWLIIATLALSLVCVVVNPLLDYLFGIQGLSYLFGLSKEGLSHFLIWQPFTHLFVQPQSALGISLGFLIGLAFNIYIIWVIGTVICDRIGENRFAYFYIGIGAISGLIAILFASYYYVLLGPFGSIIALFTFWAMLGPENEVLLFFIIPIKVKWLFAILVGGLLLVSLSRLDGVTFVQTLVAAILAYVYGAVAWQLQGPFTQMAPLDRLLYRLSDHLPKSSAAVHPTKIYDLRTGEPVMDDDAFVDEMLAKIAKHGEESLSWSERKRMQDISAKKRNQQK